MILLRNINRGSHILSPIDPLVLRGTGTWSFISPNRVTRPTIALTRRYYILRSMYG
jgi:hypothetical protein